jgi:hypothetical protein
MSVLAQEFVVADVVPLLEGVASHTFPRFLFAGTLVILEPPCVVSDHELVGYSACVRNSDGSAMVFDYETWHSNPANVIGLLFREPRAAAIPRRSKVTFVKRA